MTTFAKPIFSATTYAAFRPAFPASVFSSIMTYHLGVRTHALDLGCGHGISTRVIAPFFTQVSGIDPSASMLAQAARTSPPPNAGTINYKEAAAEDLEFLPSASVDLVLSTQAAHWFDFSRLWPQLARVVRSGGTLAILGYAENVLVGRPAASAVFKRYAYDEFAREREGLDGMGDCWEQPGRDRLRRLYVEIVPPEEEWEEVKRLIYKPEEGPEEGKGNGSKDEHGQRIMFATMTLGELGGYMRTMSAYYRWLEAHPGRSSKAEGGPGDVVDEAIDAMLEAEPEWKAVGETWRDISIETEWGSVVLLARRK